MILSYCIVADPDVTAPRAGVRRMAVEEITAHGLRCFFSVLQQRPESFTQEDAMQFYGTVQAVFEKVAVIPFRFPTLLEAKPQLTEFLEGNASHYTAALEKLRHFVQMELRIVPAGGTDTPSSSGKEYMTQRLQNKRILDTAANAARSAVTEFCAEWRQQEGREGLRCYALVTRNNVGQFQDKLKALAFEDDVRVLVTGPWPTTEFVE